MLAIACGPIAAAPPPETLRTITGTGTVGARLTVELIDTVDPITRIGTSTDGTIIITAGDRVLEQTAEGLQHRTLYAEPTDPTSLGTVSSISPRQPTGAWLATDTGLFVLQAQYVSHAPITAGMGALGTVTEATAGPFTGLWLSASNGIYRRQDESTQRYQVQGTEGSAATAAVDPLGTAAMVVANGQLFALTPGEPTPIADPGPVSGEIFGLAASNKTLWAATTQGLVRYQADATPKWSRFTLSGETIDAVAVDSLSGSTWAKSGARLFRIDADAITAFDISPGEGQLAVDHLGDVYSFTGHSLQRIEAGTPGAAVSFQTQLKPWLAQHCQRCHADFKAIDVFLPKAGTALQRVESGDMPRCEGGVICPVEGRLTADQTALLEQWIRGGTQP